MFQDKKLDLIKMWFSTTLYSPKLGQSHVAFLGKIADTLVEAGHDVTVLQPVFIEYPSNGTKLAKVIERPRDFPVTYSVNLQSNVWEANEQGLVQAWKIASFIGSSRYTMCKHLLQDEKLLDRLRAEKFDLGIGEYTCFHGLVEKIGVEKYVTAFNTALTGAFIIGLPNTPSFVPNYVANAFPDTYFSRAKNLFETILSDIRTYGPFLGTLVKAIRENHRSDFDLIEKIGKSAFFLLNVDEFTDFPRPISHKIIYIGGMGHTQPNPLEPKYEKIMESAQRGAVLVTFGSAAESFRMPEALKKRFLEAFAQFPNITFIWKYEQDEDNIADGYTNVVTGNWLPQKDLLAHPKMLGFITHGGQNSLSEASYHGVPLICIPLFADQPRNGILVEYRKIGKRINKQEILDGKLSEALKEILENPSYRKNAKRLAAMIKDKPMKPEERLVKYVEFAAKFGNDNNLDMQGREMNFFEYYCLDIIIPIIFLTVLVCYLAFKSAMRIWKIISYLIFYKKIKND